MGPSAPSPSWATRVPGPDRHRGRQCEGHHEHTELERGVPGQFLAPRLAYAVDWTPVKPLTLYHNLEYLPAFDHWAGDYLLNIDAGLRVGVWKGFFTDFKVELRYDADPAPGRKDADTRYIVGVGWQF
jgi:Protein of unknown function, DUF481